MQLLQASSELDTAQVGKSDVLETTAHLPSSTHKRGNITVTEGCVMWIREGSCSELKSCNKSLPFTLRLARLPISVVNADLFKELWGQKAVWRASTARVYGIHLMFGYLSRINSPQFDCATSSLITNPDDACFCAKMAHWVNLSDGTQTISNAF